MEVLWTHDPATVQTVQKALHRRLAYTTVQTMLNVLHRKGKVRRMLKGRSYVHRPVLSRHQALARTIDDLVNRWFGGSATELVMTLIEDRRVSEEKLTELRDWVSRVEADADDED